MPSLENRVVRQRNIVIARGTDIGLHADRVQRRLHPSGILISAFLAGMVVVRGAPPILRLLPKLTGRLRDVTEELRKLDAIVKLIALLASTLPHSSGVDADGSNDVQPCPVREDSAGRHLNG